MQQLSLNESQRVDRMAETNLGFQERCVTFFRPNKVGDLLQAAVFEFDEITAWPLWEEGKII